LVLRVFHIKEIRQCGGFLLYKKPAVSGGFLRHEEVIIVLRPSEKKSGRMNAAMARVEDPAPGI
jgi:hypothetical protein